MKKLLVLLASLSLLVTSFLTSCSDDDDDDGGSKKKVVTVTFNLSDDYTQEAGKTKTVRPTVTVNDEEKTPTSWAWTISGGEEDITFDTETINLKTLTEGSYTIKLVVVVDKKTYTSKVVSFTITKKQETSGGGGGGTDTPVVPTTTMTVSILSQATVIVKTKGEVPELSAAVNYNGTTYDKASYDWYFDGEVKAHTTKYTPDITDTNKGHEIKVKVTSEDGKTSATSSIVTITVKPDATEEETAKTYTGFITASSSTTIAEDGQIPTFRVDCNPALPATGVTYQWKLNGVNKATTATYAPAKADVPVSATPYVIAVEVKVGDTAVTINQYSSLTVSAKAPEKPAVTYTASVVSSSTLSMEVGATIPTFRVNVVTNPAGAATTITDYKWTINGADVNVTTATFTPLAASVGTIGSYTIGVTLKINDEAVTVTPATLTVTAKTIKFAIANSLARQEVAIGEDPEPYNITVVGANGGSPDLTKVSYTWTESGQADAAPIVGNGGTSYEPKIDTSKAGKSSVHVTVTYDGFTLTSNFASIIVKKGVAKKPVLAENDVMLTTAISATKTNTLKSTLNNEDALDTLTYKWYEVKEGQEEPVDLLQTGSSLTRQYKTKDDLGLKHYYCIITNTKKEGDETLTATARYETYVNVIPVNALQPDVPALQSQSIKQQDGSGALKALEAKPLNFTAIQTQGGSLSYKWYKQDGYAYFKWTIDPNSGSPTVGTEIGEEVMYGEPQVINAETQYALSNFTVSLSKAAETTKDDTDPNKVIFVKNDDGSYKTTSSDIDRFTRYYCVVTNTLTDTGDGGVKKVITRSNDAIIRICAKSTAAVPICVPLWDGGTYIVGKGPIKRAFAYAIDGGTITYRWYLNGELVQGPSDDFQFNSNNYIHAEGTYKIGLAVTNTNAACDVKETVWDYWRYFPATMTFDNTNGRDASEAPITGEVIVNTTPGNGLPASWDCFSENANIYAFAYTAAGGTEWIAGEKNGENVNSVKLNFNTGGSKVGFKLCRFAQGVTPSTKDDFNKALNSTADAVPPSNGIADAVGGVITGGVGETITGAIRGNKWTATWQGSGSASSSDKGGSSTPSTPGGSTQEDTGVIIREQVKQPTITPAGKEAEEKLELTFACATSGAAIKFTIDGSEPTQESLTPTNNKYTISLNGKTEKTTIFVKARAFKLDYDDSSTAQEVYTLTPKVEAAQKVETTYTITGMTDAATGVTGGYGKDGAVIIVHTWGPEGDKDIVTKATDFANNTLTFKADFEFDGCIVARMPAGSTSIDWGKTWNQSKNIESMTKEHPTAPYEKQK